MPDKVKVFASYLITDATIQLIRTDHGLQFIPLSESWEQAGVEAEIFRASKLSEQERLVLFPKYKELRHVSSESCQTRRQFMTRNFRRDLTKEEIWEKAEGIVRGWLGGKGIETKG